MTFSFRVTQNVYPGKLTILQYLKTETARFIRAIPSDMWKIVVGNFTVRLYESLGCRGAYMNVNKFLQTEEELERSTRDKIL